jgi:hypothetical protein
MGFPATLEKFAVSFYDAVNGNLHSQVVVEVEKVADAVNAAIDLVKEDYKEDVSRHRAAVTNLKGEGVAGIDGVSTKQQLIAEAAALAAKIAALEDDGSADETPAPAAPVPAAPPITPATTTVTAPPPFNAGQFGAPPVSEGS